MGSTVSLNQEFVAALYSLPDNQHLFRMARARLLEGQSRVCVGVSNPAGEQSHGPDLEQEILTDHRQNQ